MCGLPRGLVPVSVSEGGSLLQPEPASRLAWECSLTYRGEMARIKRREDTDPDEGERKYGDVDFADPVNNKYPIDTEEHVRAAWSYVNKEANAAKYSSREEVDRIKDRIRAAGRRFDIEFSDD